MAVLSGPLGYRMGRKQDLACLARQLERGILRVSGPRLTTSQIPNARDRHILVQALDGISFPGLCDSREVMAEVAGRLLLNSSFLLCPCHGRVSVAIRSLTGTEGQLKVDNEYWAVALKYEQH